MGTRSVTHFKDSNNADPLMTLWRQYDGNPENHGLDMVRFMQGKLLLNGYNPLGNDMHNFNGMGDLAAQMVAHFKTHNHPLIDVNGAMLPDMRREPRYTEPRIGNFEIVPPGTHDVGEQYSYGLYPEDGQIFIRVIGEYDNELMYDGPIADYPWS
jgi:hypothetical protein